MKRSLSLILLLGALVVGVATPASAGVDDFSFDSFDGQYELTRDAEGHSVLTTTETLVAVFPEFDQNRGIRRLLVRDYDGHPTDLRLQAVTDENGNPRHYETDGEGDFLEVVIADDDVYVHGEQTYVITYTQHNVTRFFADTAADEFYWDTNGTGWAQPFGEVTATVTLDPDLMAAHNGNADAVFGRKGESNPATVSATGSGYTFSASDLGPGENLTFAIGFKPGTFEPRDGSFFASPWPPLALIFALGGLVVAAAAAFTRARRLRDAPGRGIIVPEYLAPKNANVFLSAVILKKQATVAAILKLAVAGNIRVLELPGRKPHYQLQFITADGTDRDEREFLHALFGNTLDFEEVRSLQKADQKAAARIAKLVTRVTKDATANGFRRKMPAARIALLLTLGAASTFCSFIFSVIALDRAYGGAWPVLFLGVGIATAIATSVLVAKVPLTQTGVELRDYLRGLEMYMKLAEADRIRYLQSPQGALRTPVATDDPAEVVKLNEKLLPYAVLFGHEKEWAEELGRYYEELGQQPGWYAGQGAFNAGLFASSIGTMAASTASAYSSSSGGSGGGGSSGGGGGGGGGGGV